MLRILQISDTHLAPSRPEYVDNWHACVSVIEELAPDLVINSGDITMNGADEPEEFAHARALHDALSMPWRTLAGNHDVGDSRKSGYVDPPKPLVTEERIANYVEHFGPDRWLEDLGGWRLIGLNTQLWGSDLPAEAAQEEFLATATAEAGGRPVALFLHQPLYVEHAGEDSEPRRYTQNPARGRLLEALGGGDTRLISSGHIHQWRDVEKDGRRHVWAPSSAFIIDAPTPSRTAQKIHGMVEICLHESGEMDVRLIEAAGLEAHDIVAQIRGGITVPPSYSTARLAADSN